MARGRRSDYTWQGIATGVSGFSLASVGSGLQGVVGISTASMLVRVRGEIVASLDGPTDGDKTGIAMGLIRGTEEDIAIGVTAMPDLATDLDADWLWHGFVVLQAQAANLEHGVVQRLTVDSKAMRKFRQGEQLIFVASNVNVTGTAATDLTFGFRALFAT